MIRVVSVITVEDGDDDHNKIKRGKGQECTFMLRTLYTEYFFFFFSAVDATDRMGNLKSCPVHLFLLCLKALLFVFGERVLVPRTTGRYCHVRTSLYFCLPKLALFAWTHTLCFCILNSWLSEVLLSAVSPVSSVSLCFIQSLLFV